MTNREALAELRKEIGSFKMMGPNERLEDLPNKKIDFKKLNKIAREVGEILEREAKYASTSDRGLPR